MEPRTCSAQAEPLYIRAYEGQKAFALHRLPEVGSAEINLCASPPWVQRIRLSCRRQSTLLVSSRCGCCLLRLIFICQAVFHRHVVGYERRRTLTERHMCSTYSTYSSSSANLGFFDRKVMTGCRELLGDRDVQTLQSGNSLARQWPFGLASDLRRRCVKVAARAGHAARS